MPTQINDQNYSDRSPPPPQAASESESTTTSETTEQAQTEPIGRENQQQPTNQNMETTQQTITTPKIAVIGCGNMGLNTLRLLSNEHKLRSDIQYIAIDADNAVLTKFAEETKITNIIPFSKSGFGFGMRYEEAKECFISEQKLEQVWSLIEDKHIVFILVGFGGGSGAGATRAIVDFLKSKGIVVVLIPTLPSLEEGTRKRKNAIRCRDEVIASNDKLNWLSPIDSQKIYDKNIDKNPTINELNALSSVIANQCLNSILTILTKVGDSNIDFNDVRTTLCGGRCLFLENSTPEQDKTLVQAEKSAKSMLYAFEDSILDNFGYMLFNIQSSNEVGAKDRSEVLKNYKTKKGDQTVKFGFIQTDNDYFELSTILGGLPDYEDQIQVKIPVSIRDRVSRLINK